MAEESKHLTYFKVENFKCFDSFEMEDIGQFNLILGDNNVGKTTVVEALLFDENLTKYFSNLIHLLSKHFGTTSSALLDFNRFNYLDYLSNNKIHSNNIDTFFTLLGENIKHYMSIKYLESPEKEDIDNFLLQKSNSRTDTDNLVQFTKDKKTEFNTLNIKNHIPSITNRYCPLINSIDLYEFDLVEFYSSKVQISKILQTEFINDLRTFIAEIEDIEVGIPFQNIPNSSPILNIRLKNVDKPLPLGMMGDGAIKIFRIILELLVTSNTRLMIDEIDSGIHYSHFKDYWRTIIKSASRNNVQLFMTTHNFECLKYLKEVLEEEDMVQYQDKTRSYTLQKLADGHVKSYKYTFEQFEYSVEQNLEIRGR